MRSCVGVSETELMTERRAIEKTKTNRQKTKWETRERCREWETQRKLKTRRGCKEQKSRQTEEKRRQQ